MPESASELTAVVERLRAQLVERDRVIAGLTAQVGVLTARLVELERRLGKNSSNSSKPPSSDNPFTKPPPRSLRGESGRRPGKQAGERGTRLESRADPDQIAVHAPDRCAECGGDLVEAAVIGEEARQVFELPPIRLRVIEHRVQRRRCGCGQVTTGVFPAEANAPTCYGPGVAALGAYLLARQHLPVARAAELMNDCLGAPVSTGWLAGLLGTAAARLEDFDTEVRDQLRAASAAHFDETGARVAGKLWWIHVAATDGLTAYHRAPSRGEASMNLGEVLPGFTGVAVHDGLTSYRHYDVEHGLCNVHHLRELKAVAETLGDEVTWPIRLGELLVEMHAAVTAAKATGQTRLPARTLADYQRRYRALIAEGQKAHPPPPRTGKQGRPSLGVAGALLRRLDRFEDDVLRFAHDFAVPFDNNQAERDIRMIRLQQKISGSWRTQHGADDFLRVRGYLSTARKHRRNCLQALHDLFTGNAWIPAPAP